LFTTDMVRVHSNSLMQWWRFPGHMYVLNCTLVDQVPPVILKSTYLWSFERTARWRSAGYCIVVDSSKEFAIPVILHSPANYRQSTLLSSLQSFITYLW
jgi:hypothetical protein